MCSLAFKARADSLATRIRDMIAMYDRKLAYERLLAWLETEDESEEKV